MAEVQVQPVIEYLQNQSMVDDKPAFIMMVGIQGSGKSTIANAYSNLLKMPIVNTDKLRKEFPDENNDSIFKKAHGMIKSLLFNKVSCIFDATNLCRKRRTALLKDISVFDCYKICIVVNTDKEICTERVEERNKRIEEGTYESFEAHVPIEVIDKYEKSFEIPFYEEGWDYIKIQYEPNLIDSEKYKLALRVVAEGFNQNNKHHTQLLGEHLDYTTAQIRKRTKNRKLIEAAQYHDVGKLFTQTYKEGDPNAHYYSHANVGTYKLLCNCGYFVGGEYSEKDTLEWLFYINYHMQMYDMKTDKIKNKWKAIFGEEKFKNLTLLNKCDKKHEHYNKKKPVVYGGK